MDLAPNPWRALLGLAGLLAAMSCGRGDADTHRSPAAPAPTAAAPPPPAAIAPPRGRQLTLVYSSNQLAAYETCGCPGHPMGGLARRATQIDRARADADDVLVLDAGDLFTPAPVAGTPAPAREIERRGRLLAAAYQRMGTTALVPGERDLALGVPLLRRLAEQADLPLVAANLVGRDGKPLFDADRIIETKLGTKVGILGVTVPPSAADAAAWRRAGVEVRDPVAAAQESVRSLRARGAQLVIGLLHLPTEAESRKLLQAVPTIDWAVLGHVGLRYESAQRTSPDGTTWMLSVMPEGKELGRADLHIRDGLAFVDRGVRTELETILADHRRQLLEHDKPLGNVDRASLRDHYDARRKQLGEAIARDQVALAKLPPTIEGSWFENRLIPLDTETPNQAGVATLIDAYTRESARLRGAGKRVGLPGDEAPLPSLPPDPTSTTATPGAGGARPKPALAPRARPPL